MASHFPISLINFLIILTTLLLSQNRATATQEDDDVACLKAIKTSLHDPNNVLSSWQFHNTTSTTGFICSFTGIECWNLLENRVLSINLNSLQLKGKLPSGISKCQSLMGLNLSNNSLHGSIPRDISSMLPFLVTLSLSSNDFSGEIPASIGNCSYLNVLELDHNRFSGRIPSTVGLLRRLRKCSVAYNMLVGPIPRFRSGFNYNASSYAHNAGLCGYPLKSCTMT